MKTTSLPSWKGRRRDAFCIASRALPAFSLLAVVTMAGPAAAGPPDGPFGTGNVEKGKISLDLFRGAAVPLELTVLPTPCDCTGHLELAVEWDADDNEVEVKLTGEPGSLFQFPDVDRTEGVNWFPNAFLDDPTDFEDGRYQLWIATNGGPTTIFYYDPMTLDLLGSEYDFEVPPPAIPVFFPTFYMTATDVFQPAADGSVDELWTFNYDAMTRGDLPQFSHHIVSLPPPNLCEVNPDRLDLSTLRLYFSDPLPASEAFPFSNYLRDGLGFDVTVEPADYYLDPPKSTTVATYSGSAGIGGGIPRGWNLDLDAAFMNVAPPIRPWAGAGSCEPWTVPFHSTGLNVCGGA